MSLAKSIAEQLAGRAETVCRHYLSSGYRVGSTWKAGDVHNTRPKPHRGSLVVQLAGPYAGLWQDFNPAAEHERGDLLDLIRYARGYADLRDAMDEARRFLGASAVASIPSKTRADNDRKPIDRTVNAERAARIFRTSKPLAGSQAEGYLCMRGILSAARFTSLRGYPRLRYPIDPDNPEPQALSHYPAMVAAVTDIHGKITGIQRTFLEPGMPIKAKVEEPKKSLGKLYGHAVWFGEPTHTAVVGEGLETVLSVFEALTDLVGAAVLGGNIVPALILPGKVQRLLIARDNGPAGKAAAEKLRSAVEPDGVDVIDLSPSRDDFNDDLRAFGRSALAELLSNQIPDP